MAQSLEYEDLLGNKFTLISIPSDDRIQKDKLKSRKCPKKYELNRLIRSLFISKPQLHSEIEFPPSTCKPVAAKNNYQPGLIVQVDSRTTVAELQRLLQVGVRTHFVRLGFATPDETNEIMSKINNAIDLFNKNKPFIMPIGLAVEMRGHQLRTGRLRNNKPLEIQAGSLLVLTSDTKYKYLSLREIVYVSNFTKYLPLLQLGDIIFMNKGKIRLRIVKILNHNITCCIEAGNFIRSYMNIDLPYYAATHFECTPEDLEDIQFAKRYNVQFVVLPAVSNSDYIKNFKKFISSCHSCEVFAVINTCIAANKCIARDIIQNCDGIWLDQLFKRDQNNFSVDNSMRDMLQLSKTLELPIIAKIPIKVRPDFTKLQNHEVLHYLDSILIEKSSETQSFPLIARKLFCDQRPINKEDELLIKGNTEEFNINNQLAETINFHISIQKCVAVIISSKINYDTAKLLSRKHLYCPIIVVTENEMFAKQLNIYRNIKVVLFKSKNDSETKRLEFGMDYGLWSKLFTEGDFIISFHDSIHYDCVNSKYRALYVPKKNLQVAKYDRGNYSYTCSTEDRHIDVSKVIKVIK